MAAYVRTVPRVALTEAVRLGIMAPNPPDRAKAPRQEPHQVEAFTAKQLAALFDAAQGTRAKHLVPLAAYAGLRRGELAELKWEDVDLARGALTVRRNRTQATHQGITVGEPKSEAGRRTLTLPAPALKSLRRQRERQLADKKAALATGRTWRNPEGWVFTTAWGGPLEPNRVSRDYRRLRDRAVLPGTVPFHGLRHTAVSLQVAAGVPLEVISRRIGHSDFALTANVYGHLLLDAGLTAAASLDDYLGGQKAPENPSRENR